MSFDQKAYIADYRKEKYKSYCVRVTPEEKAAIDAALQKRGMSLRQFLVWASKIEE